MTLADSTLFRLAMQCGVVKRGLPNDTAVVVICCRCYLWFLSFLLLFLFFLIVVVLTLSWCPLFLFLLLLLSLALQVATEDTQENAEGRSPSSCSDEVLTVWSFELIAVPQPRPSCIVTVCSQRDAKDLHKELRCLADRLQGPRNLHSQHHQQARRGA